MFAADKTPVLDLRNGLYNFKRVKGEGKDLKICTFQLYCTDLQEKALTEKGLQKLKDSDEMIGTTWKCYDFKNLKPVPAPHAKARFEIEFKTNSKVQVKDTKTKDLKEMNWEMSADDEKIEIKLDGTLKFTAVNEGKTIWTLKDTTKDAAPHWMIMMSAPKSKR